MDEKLPNKFNIDNFRRLFIMIALWLAGFPVLLLIGHTLRTDVATAIFTWFCFVLISGSIGWMIHKKLTPGHKLP